jgi:hypothetical protein
VLDDDKNCYYDHARGEGEGVVDFVGKVLGLDRKAALEWLAKYAGVPLTTQTDKERLDYQQRRSAAETEGRALRGWRNDKVEALRIHSDGYFQGGITVPCAILPPMVRTVAPGVWR